ncbi:MAG: tetratricopeptide repeat protein [Bacteroidota bacterium]
MKKRILVAVLMTIGFNVSAQTLKDAIRLNENEQHDEASSVYQKLISIEPTKGDYYYYWGNNLLDADKSDSASIIFSEGLKKDPTNYLLQIGNAELKLAAGNLIEGKALIESTVKSAGNKNALILIVAAEALIRHKKAQDLILARVYLDAALKIDAKNPDVYNLIGDIYSEENNGSEAAKYYNLALEKEGKYIKSVFHKGQLYKRSMSYEIAITEFNNTLKIDPNFAPAYRELGECYYKLRKSDLAKENYKKYLELSKNNNNARLRYASFLFQSAEYNDAAYELSLITKVDSANMGMMRMMAYVNYEIGKNDTALKTIAKVFDMTKEDTTKRIGKDYSYYGKIMNKSGNVELGTYYIQNALSIDPKQGELYDDLADMYNKQKKYDLSAITYESKINNSTKPAITDYFNMGRAWYNAKNYIKADSAFAKVTEINPAWPNGYFWRGRANAQIDNTAKEGLAKPFYAKYIELANADVANLAKQKNNLIEANSYLAFAAFVAKDCTLSIEYWNKVLEIDPSTKQAKDSIEAIKASKDCK